MQEITKDYDHAFLLEPTKLIRLVDKIHDRMADFQSTNIRDRFEIFSLGNRREVVTSIDHVLAQENSRKRRITRLLLVSSAFVEDIAEPQQEVVVDFAKEKGTGNNITKVVAVSVRSEADGWAGRTLSEIEEQVERTWQHHLRPTLTLVLIVLAALIVFILLLFSSFNSVSGRPAYAWMWLGNEDAERIAIMLENNAILNENELREVASMQLRNLVKASNPLPKKERGAQLLFVGLPTLVVVGCSIFLLKVCYPKTVFLWGDEVDRYKSVEQRRQILWNIIIGVVLVGIASKLLYEGIVSW